METLILNQLLSLCLFPPKVKDYDYYGAYDTKKNVNYKYNELLGREYTFNFPPHHDVVSVKLVLGVAELHKQPWGPE